MAGGRKRSGRSKSKGEGIGICKGGVFHLMMMMIIIYYGIFVTILDASNHWFLAASHVLQSFIVWLHMPSPFLSPIGGFWSPDEL